MVQFCTDAFADYAFLTDAQNIFSTQFRYLTFFRYFWQYNVFIFTILILVVLSLIYFSLCGSNDREFLKTVQAQIMLKYRVNIAKDAKQIARKGGNAVALSKKPKGMFG